jgi:hypothetical protein
LVENAKLKSSAAQADDLLSADNSALQRPVQERSSENAALKSSLTSQAKALQEKDAKLRTTMSSENETLNLDRPIHFQNGSIKTHRKGMDILLGL